MLGHISEGREDGAARNTGERKQLSGNVAMRRKDKRKVMKKQKRTKKRREMALKLRQEEAARMNDPHELLMLRLMEEQESRKMEMDRKEFEYRERLWIEALEKKQVEDNGMAEEQNKALLEWENNKVENHIEFDEDRKCEYIDDVPAKIIWQGNEIIVQKTKVRIGKSDLEKQSVKEDIDRPTSNPFPPQTFDEYKDALIDSTQRVAENVSQQSLNFGTEQDKAHCPFHFKTGACRFGHSCSRLHIYPDKSCTILLKNMYNGPGLAWEQDEGLEHTDEEIERCYEEFYEDVHTEFLKYGEILNFKVCRNCSSHLRGNVYVHYSSLASAQLAYRSINGRYFAGKQISCEFVNVAKWKVAICGEYMKSRMKNCSRGSACNFIHCFCNPGGEYEWANWDKAAPRYWVKKMGSLFGHSSDGYGYYWKGEEERRRSKSIDRDRHEHSRRSRSESSLISGSKRRRRRVADGERCDENWDKGCHDYSNTDKNRRHKRSSRRRKHPRREGEGDRWDGGLCKTDETDPESTFS